MSVLFTPVAETRMRNLPGRCLWVRPTIQKSELLGSPEPSQYIGPEIGTPPMVFVPAAFGCWGTGTTSSRDALAFPSTLWLRVGQTSGLPRNASILLSRTGGLSEMASAR
jgi:hypothetical protein